MKFEFATAARIVFGRGALRELGGIAAGLGTRAIVVAGGPPALAAGAVEVLAARGVAATVHVVRGEPALGGVRAGVEAARTAGADLVVAIGGGSVIDSGKAIAALVANGGDPLDYLEVVGQGRPIALPSLACIAVPTTAGTGSEVTRNAVIASPEHRVKASLRSPHLLPRVALVDPELTLGVPAAVTAATGMDALTQLIEPLVSARANPLTDALCREGLRRGAGALARACRDGADVAAREDLSFAALCGGLALANSGLGAVHGFAAPIGGMFEAPHGAVCARLLGPVIEANLRALRQRDPGHPALQRYDEVARIVTGRADAVADDAAQWAHSIAFELGIPRLSAYGLSAAAAKDVVAAAQKASSMQANPVRLTADELESVLHAAM
jgi:alcohol dehydrogenase class IV